MRRIEVVEGLSVRFPGRSQEFVEGVEIGLLAAALATSAPEIVMRLASGALEQAQQLAHELGYLTFPDTRAVDGDTVEVRFRSRSARPRLQLVR